MGIFSRLFGGGQEGEGDPDAAEQPSGEPLLATAGAGAANVAPPSFTPAPAAPAPMSVTFKEPATQHGEPKVSAEDPATARPRMALPKLPKRDLPGVAPMTSPATPARPAPPEKPADKPVEKAVEKAAEKSPEKLADKHDATTIMNPPPAPKPQPAARPTVKAAPAPAPRPAPKPAPKPEPPAAPVPEPVGKQPSQPVVAAVPEPVGKQPSQPVASIDAGREPVPPAPVPKWSGRKKSDSVGEAFERAISQSDIVDTTPVVSAPVDLAAVRAVFNDVAAVHVSQVRDVMLELQYGDALPSWMELTKPALKSLRAMAAQMELADLCTALDEFCAAVDVAIVEKNAITEGGKTELLRRYERLIELIPQAFALDSERDRREPIIIEALLFQIDGVERPIIDKLFGVGLNRLDALIRANVDDMVAVSGIRREIAEAIVEQFRTYRSDAKSIVSAPDAMAERRQLHDLLITLSLQNDDYNRVATGWTDEARAAKRNLRKQREQTFQRIKVALARLGEKDQVAKLERMPFQERIATIDRYLSAQPAARP
ncbi:MAG TPA: hypothetical protein VFQ53_06555 [Kofleriaceae bacterium]|nr:hypothetical protein [Kofleriaceae bacterium]